MRAAGQRPRLVIGPWTHASRDLFAASLREAVSFFRTQLGQEERKINDVTVYVGGADEWREFDQWPPVGRTQEWLIRPGGALDLTATGSDPQATAKSDRFRYDPADPTPSVGGALFTTNGGPVDNRALEARPDVLVYTQRAADRRGRGDRAGASDDLGPDIVGVLRRVRAHL